MVDLAVATHRLLDAPDNGVTGEVEATPLADRVEAVRAIAKIAA